MKNILSVLCVCILVATSVVQAQIPKKISYQGVLTISAGTPATDGNYTLAFNVFENPTGGTSLYTEAHASVPVSRGTFKVILGSVTTLTLPFDRTYFLEMTVTSGPNVSSPMT
ncbi:MAG: hypothetical protein HYZ34_01620, partial [Ignavibacteriae bacterium]|nr:hypothetical protein [Ignavibacteriota bacterium]